ncbi:MAG: alpha-L-arabinofuranosidase C-terminal domain-containing protein [Chthoniobacter sp.]|nr:alpha-L-arabinofuranosidase C-terminal domain-containing protein [Chthoniobacter sp.]
MLISVAALSGAEDEKSPPVVTIHAEPIHDGRISPLLFGGFIELLDDVVPAMWAEMLNDRSFEGVEPALPQHYFDGTPDICDRPWDPNATWICDHDRPFNGTGCARLTAAPDHPATITQSGLAVRAGTTYHFSGYFRTDGSPLTATVSLKTLLPDGSWMTLASAPLPEISDSWQKCAASMTSRGVTDRVVFELKVQGTGCLWADKLSLMPEDNVHGWRRDVVDIVRDLHPPIIRWGGSTIDPGQYQWKKGVGDRDARTPFRNKVWGRIDSNDVGIDEFCQFCEVVNAQPLLCVSLADGPESAADLVQYCNGDATSTWGAQRAAHGHPAPYHVKYWQVGNEIAGDKPAYLEQIGNFIRLIKNADPGAQVMSSYPAQELLDVAGKDLAFVCPHQYTRDFAKIDSSLRKISEMIDTTPGCGHLKIAVTEWNVSGGEWGWMRARQMTLETALFNARHLHLLMRHCDKVVIANRSNMANSYCGAIFETNPAGVLKRPGYYVMDLYTRHARPLPLKVEGAPDGPDFFACASADKKNVTLFAVNSEAKPLPFRLAGTGFEKQLRIVSAEAVCDTQDARQIDVMNHWDTPDRVKIMRLSTSGDTVILPALSVTAIESEPSE